MKKINTVLLFLILFLCSQSAFTDAKSAYEHNEKGVQALNQNNYRIAIEHFLLALRETPGSQVIKNNLSNAYHDYGAHLYEKGEFYNARDNFLRSLRYNSRNVFSLIDLGRTYYRQNELNKALTYLKRAHSIKSDIKGLGDLISKIENETAVENKLDKIDSTHFIIVKDRDISIDNLANIKISLEQAYSRVGSFFSHFPSQKIPVIIYPPAAYQKLNQGSPQWAHAHFDGKIRLPLAGRNYSMDYLRKIIYHEFAHAVIRDLTKGNIPLWLNEGIASYVENFVEFKTRSFFTQYINKKTFIGFERLPSSYSQISGSRAANLYYREFTLLANFIIDKYGNTGLRNILLILGKGGSFEQAIGKVLGISSREFSRSWQKYVEAKLGF